MNRPIAVSLSPNTEKDDVLLALKTLFSPISWFNFDKTQELERKFAEIFGKNYKALAINSGRSGLYLILKGLGIGKGDEVIVQAMTCVAVPNAVIWNQATPVYVDVDKTFNIDPRDLIKKITTKTKAIVVQHSFGVPAEMDKIIEIAKKRKIPVIEDCALALGATYKGKKVGTLGNYAFFSFGRDKVISSVFGGMILVRNGVSYSKLFEERDSLDYPSPFWIIQQLLHPILFIPILVTYNFGIEKVTLGKLLLFLLQKLRILSRAVYPLEKKGGKPKIFPQKMPGALVILALRQFDKLERFNQNRIKISNVYFNKLNRQNINLPMNKKGAIWMRFPILVKDKEKLFSCMKKNNILLGDWYKDVVIPTKNLSNVYYEKGSCPNAEKYSKELINLPTYPTLAIKDVNKVIDTLSICLSTK